MSDAPRFLVETKEILYVDLASLGGQIVQIPIGGTVPSTAHGYAVEVAVLVPFAAPGFSGLSQLILRVGPNTAPDQLFGGGQGFAVSGISPITVDNYGLSGQQGSAPTLSVGGRNIVAQFEMPSGQDAATLTDGSVLVSVKLLDDLSQEGF